MKMLWKIISNIYTELVVGAGLPIDPPYFLFNQPNRRLQCEYHDIILVDKTFTTKQQELIRAALKDLQYFCNGLIEINLIFDLDPEDKERIKNHSVLLNVDSSHPAIEASDERLQAKTLGLCEWLDNDTKRLYLVQERLPTDIIFRTTAIHELGHFIGMGHTEIPSIMHKNNNSNVLYPTYKDAKELSEVWDVYPGYFRYFKM